MKIKPEELTKNGYVLLDKLGHKELAPFILTFIKKRTKYSVFYYIINFIFLGLVGYFFVQGYNLSDYTFGNRFNHFSYGLAIALLLIPLHEYIHVLAYKSACQYDLTEYIFHNLRRRWKKFNFHPNLPYTKAAGLPVLGR